MAVGPTSVDLRVRALLDQNLAPLDQVVAKLEAATKALQDNASGGQKATISEKEYSNALKESAAGLTQTIRLRAELTELSQKQAQADKANADLAARDRAATNTAKFFTASGTRDPTEGQQALLDKLNTKADTQRSKTEALNAALAQQLELVQRLGLVSKDATAGPQLDPQIKAANARLDELLTKNSQIFEQGKNSQSEFVARLQQALKLTADLETLEETRLRLNKEQITAIRQAVQARQEEAAAAEKAAAIKTEAVTRADAAVAANAAQRDALAGRASLPAPTATSQVAGALAPPPGPASTVLGLQSEVDRLSKVFATAGSEAHVYAQALRDLDAAFKELDRQAQVVTAFQARQQATNDARKAFSDATTEVERLKAALATASGPQVSEISSQIASLQRQIGSSDTGGLAGKFAREREALEQERVALTAIGATTDTVGEAYVRLTATAVQGAETRRAAAQRERDETLRGIEQAQAKAATLAAGLAGPAVARTPTLQETVSSLVPGRNDPRDIQNVAEAIDGLSDKMGKGRLTAQTYNEVMDQVFAIQEKLVTDATLINQFKDQSDAVNRARQAFADASASLAGLQEKAKTSAVSLREVQQAETNIGNAADKVRQEQQAFANLSASLKQRKIDTDNINQAEKDLIATTTRLGDATKSIQQSAGTAFGLSAFQVQNLGFQINDVITQLSLGQGVFRTLASQGGQIFQIFDLSLATLKEFAIALAAVGPPLVILGLAFERLQQTQQAQRQFAGELAGSTNIANTTSVALVRLQREIERTGIGFQDAGKAVALFVQQGLNTDQIEKFAQAARNLAEGTGKDFGQVAKDLSSIPTADDSKLLELARSYGVLTPELVKYVNAQTEAGRVTLAQQAVFDALAARGKAAQAQAIGPLTQSVRDLTNAWHDFLDVFGNSDAFLALINSSKDLLQSFTNFIQVLQGGAPDISAFTKAILDLDGKLKNLILPFPGLQNEVLKFLGILDRKPGTLLDASKAKVIELTAAYEDARKKADEMATDPRTAGSSWLDNQNRLAESLKKQLDDAIALKNRLEQPGGLQAGSVSSPPTATPGLAPVTGELHPIFSGPEFTPDKRVNRTIPADMVPIIADAAAKAGVSVNELNALYRNEAVRNTDGSFATSSAGARGPLQVMAGTFAEVVAKNTAAFEALAAKTGVPTNINDPQANTLAGALYYRQQLDDFKSPALAAAAYNAGPAGTRNAMRTGQFADPHQTLPYVANFVASAGNSFQAPTSAASSVSPYSVTGQANLEIARKKVQDELDKTTDSTIRGFSDQALKVDSAYQEQVKREERARILALSNQTEFDDKTTAVYEQAVQRRLQERFNQRQQQAQEDETQGENALAAAKKIHDQTLAAGGDLDAARRLAEERFVAPINALKEAISKGATDFGGQDPTKALEDVIKERTLGIQQAAADASKVALDQAVALRDNLITGAEDSFKKGAISLGEMFRLIGDAVKNNAPAIATARDTAVRELGAAQQTPKNIATAQAVQNTDVNGRQITQTADDLGFQDIQKLIAARDSQIKEIQDLLSRSTIGGTEADQRIQAAYAKTAPQINAEITALQTILDLQKQANEITPAYYEKQSAALRKLTGETNDLTQAQKELNRGFEQSVTSRTLQGLDAISQAIADVVSGTLTWKQGISAIGVAFAQTALGIIKDISSIIIKEELLNAIKAAGGLSGIVKGVIGLFGAVAGGAAGGGGDFSGAAATASADADISFASNYQVPVRHIGGTVGDIPLMRRAVSLPSHVTATWMHSGGVAGLKSNESLTVLEDGEKVVSNAQQRQDKAMQNAWKNAPPQNITAVAAFSEDDVSNALLNTPAGNRLVLLTLKRNATEAKTLLGVK